MATHMAKSSARCVLFQLRVIIHAAGPDMLPYMSSAIGTIHAQQAPATRTSEPITNSRSRRIARSSGVGPATGTARRLSGVTEPRQLPHDAVRGPVHARQVRVCLGEVE